MDRSYYKNTKAALRELETHLVCGICQLTLRDPCSLGGCQHLFCRDCAKDYAGVACPICRIPSHVKDLTVKRQIKNVIKLCQHLNKLLYEDSDAELSDLESESAASTIRNEDAAREEVEGNEREPDTEKMSSPKPGVSCPADDEMMSVSDDGDGASLPSESVEKNSLAVYNFECSPVTKVKDAKPPKRVTRRATAKEKRKQKLDNFNNAWGIGDSQASSQCLSCKGKKGARKVRVVTPTSLEGTKNSGEIVCACDSMESPNVSAGQKSLSDTNTPRRNGAKSAAESKKRLENSLDDCQDTRVVSGKDLCDAETEVPDKDLESSVEPVMKLVLDKIDLDSFEDKGSDLHELKSGLPSTPCQKTIKRRSMEKPSPASSKKTKKNSKVPSQVETPVRKAAPRSSVGTPSTQVQKKNTRGETPLHVAAINGNVEKVRQLLTEGANANTKDNAGWTPLHEAANHGFTEIVRQLLDHGAFINAPGMDNDSPVLDAVQNYRLETVKLLVSRGADIHLRNSSGQTPVNCAKTDAMLDALATPVNQVEIPATPQTPTLTPKHEKVVLLSTGLKRPQQNLVQKCAAMLRGRVVSDFSHEVTHVITDVNGDGVCPRTMKYLNAVLAGKWILNFQWIESCLDYKDPVSEEAFEIPGTTTHPELYAPQKGRNNSEKQLPRLFDGCQIYFSGNFKPPTPDKQELMQLARSGGATILNREPKLENVNPADITVPYHAKSGSYLADCCYYVIHDPNHVKSKLKKQHHYRICTAPVSWFLECISKFALLDLPPDYVAE